LVKSINKSKKIISVFLTVTFIFTMLFGSFAASGAGAGLSDIDGHWAQNTVQGMVDEGFVGGYPDGTFKPNNSITRAEFATLLVKVFSLETGSGKVFDDTANHWARDAIITANYHGLVKGYSETAFGPNDLVTREQIAVMIVNATNADSKEDFKKFTDSAQISAWAKASVDKAAATGLVAGYTDGTFRPKVHATRAEAAVVLDRGRKFVVEETITSFDKAGTYGPETGIETIESDVVINADGVVLQNTVIQGNLTISEKVGGGDVTLNNITVKGTTFVRGGGKDSIHINGGQYDDVIIEKTPEGNVRIVATDAQGLKVIISENAAGEEIILEGTFKGVTIEAEDVVLSTQGKTEIGEITVKEDITGITINLNKGTTVDKLILDSEVKLDKTEATVKEITGDKAPVASSGGSGGGGTTIVAVSAITMTTKIGEEVVEGPFANGAEVTVTLATTDGAEIYYTTDGEDPDVEKDGYENPFVVTADSEDVVIKTIKVLATKEGYTPWTGEFTIGFMAKEMTVSKLAQNYYAAGETLKFTISGLEPGFEEEISLMIYDEGPKYDYEPAELSGMTRVNQSGKTSWRGTTNEYGQLIVSGKVNPNLSYGGLDIILPNHGGHINNSISLHAMDTEGYDTLVYVGASVSVEGERVVGTTLTTTVGMPDDASVNYQWMRASAEEGPYTNISNATNDNYDLVEDDAGSYIKVVVTGTIDEKEIQASDVVGRVLNDEGVAGVVAALFVDVEADELELAVGVNQEAIDDASGLVEVLADGDEKDELAALIVAAQGLLDDINGRLKISYIHFPNSVYNKQVYLMGYAVGINVNENGKLKSQHDGLDKGSIDDTNSLVVSAYKMGGLLGEQSFNNYKPDAPRTSSRISGTLDVFGSYTSSSWLSEWTGALTDIPDTIVATVEYWDGHVVSEEISFALSGTSGTQEAPGSDDNTNAIFVEALNRTTTDEEMQAAIIVLEELLGESTYSNLDENEQLAVAAAVLAERDGKAGLVVDGTEIPNTADKFFDTDKNKLMTAEEVLEVVYQAVEPGVELNLKSVDKAEEDGTYTFTVEAEGDDLGRLHVLLHNGDLQPEYEGHIDGGSGKIQYLVLEALEGDAVYGEESDGTSSKANVNSFGVEAEYVEATQTWTVTVDGSTVESMISSHKNYPGDLEEVKLLFYVSNKTDRQDRSETIMESDFSKETGD
jgi:hypothetical protein